ncbi:hypothetical protein FIU82_01775 [Pseudoalteromonas sp. THAF3]|uniref:hypothetical protein n=1 Tax=unclassified Pseudoalteromonas TaxID=194690 RepID=UPI001267ECAD|nr:MULTISPECIES: hypothetical protein [unclassified Pseudoalteromonas]MCG7566564.1 hypothetical protein [Pseudoalteromonas sp. CnMc7-15]QFU03746.1 hypothetical protein FIU82_01775 [Pseudoalteromonas sp. THAF3]
MYILYILIALVGLTLTLNQVFSIVADERQRNKMKAVEDKLDKAGVTPSGSTLSHGMYVNKSNGELVADQKPSAVWYKRLI